MKPRLLNKQFICVGAARSGTTRLWEWLNLHPDVHMSPIKETNYFARDLIGRHGPGDRDALPDVKAVDVPTFGKRHAAIVQEEQAYVQLLTNPDKIHRGEISPSYLYHARQAAPRIHEFNPECRIIIILREPVGRAISAHSLFTAHGREVLTLRDAIFQEDERMSAGWEHAWAYKSSGFYYERVSTFFNEFGRKNVWVGLYEDLDQAPQDTFNSICDFLGAPRATILSTEKVNQSPSPNGILLRLSRTKAGNLASRFIPSSVKTKARLLDDDIMLLIDKEFKNKCIKKELGRSYIKDVNKLDRLIPALEIARKWSYPYENEYRWKQHV